MDNVKLPAARRQARDAIVRVLGLNCHRFETPWERLSHLETRIRHLEVPFKFLNAGNPMAEEGTADALYSAAHYCGLTTAAEFRGENSINLLVALSQAILDGTNDVVLRHFGNRLLSDAKRDIALKQSLARITRVRFNSIERVDPALIDHAEKLWDYAVRSRHAQNRFILGAITGVYRDLSTRSQILTNFTNLQNELIFYSPWVIWGVLSGMGKEAISIIDLLVLLVKKKMEADEAVQRFAVEIVNNATLRAEIAELVEMVPKLVKPLSIFAAEVFETLLLESEKNAYDFGLDLGSQVSAAVTAPLDTTDLSDFAFNYGEILGQFAFDIVLGALLNAAGPIVISGKKWLKVRYLRVSDALIRIVQRVLNRLPELERIIEKLNLLLRKVADGNFGQLAKSGSKGGVPSVSLHTFPKPPAKQFNKGTKKPADVTPPDAEKFPQTEELRNKYLKTGGHGGIETYSLQIVGKQREVEVVLRGNVLDSVDRKGFERLLGNPGRKQIADRTFNCLHRSHLWGPVLGDEAVMGIMYAPCGYNLRYVSIVESWLQKVGTSVRSRGGRLNLTVTARSYGPDVTRNKIPINPNGTPGGNRQAGLLRSKGELLLKQTKYDIEIEIPGNTNGSVTVGKVEFDVNPFATGPGTKEVTTNVTHSPSISQSFLKSLGIDLGEIKNQLMN
jgi:putative RNase toxin 4 of polymorphic toxin system